MIITGWGVGAGRTNYLQSAANIRVVGAETRQIKEVLRVREKHFISVEKNNITMTVLK